MVAISKRQGRAITLYMATHQLRWMLQPRPGVLPEEEEEEEEVHFRDASGRIVRRSIKTITAEYDAHLKEQAAIRRAERRRIRAAALAH